jgi:hypothetical protein
MATDKKHIAVYLDPAVEQALIAFCEQKGMVSKKGFMYSAGVNAVLAEFFGLSSAEPGNTPQKLHNIPSELNNTPLPGSNILVADNIPTDTVTQEVTDTRISALEQRIEVLQESLQESLKALWEALPGKSEGLTDFPELLKPDGEVTDSGLQTELSNLKAENETLKADYAKLLESRTHVTNKLRQELQELRSQLETERPDREENKKSAPGEKDLPEAADLLNKLKAKRKKSKTDLADLEAILELLQG